MSVIGVTGFRTTIVAALKAQLPGDTFERIDLDCPIIPSGANHFVLAAGMLRSKMIGDQSANEIAESMRVNLTAQMKLCDWILSQNDQARICLVGSQSGFKGSYDAVYAAAKAGLHHYIETRHVGKEQQLVGVAPHIILDSGMTERRPDYTHVIERAKDTPRGRYITASEVAGAIKWLLFDLSGFWVNNTIVRLTGGIQ